MKFIKVGGGYTDIIFKIIFGQRVGALWFLLTLFISMTFFKSLLNNVNDKKWLSIIGSSIYILPFLISSNNIFVEVLLKSCTAFGFITFGYLISQWIKQADIKFYIVIFFFIISIITTMLNGAVDLYDLNYGNPLLYTIMGITGTLSIISLFKSIKLKSKLLSYIGANTLIIMATHQVLLLVFNQIMSNNIIVFMLTLITEIPIIYVINSYAPWLLGKFDLKKKCVENS